MEKKPYINIYKYTMKTKLIIYGIIAAIIIGLGVTITIMGINLNKLKTEYSTAMANNSAMIYNLQGDLTSARDTLYQYQLTIDQLYWMGDSVTKRIKELQDELKIKDKQIQGFQYLESEFGRKDTVRLHDTIFRDPEFCFDTIIGDEWFNTLISLQYPGEIMVSPLVISKKYVIISGERQTIKPPKKCKFLRLFQKKHTVVKVNVKEDNPYIQSKKSEFVEILK